MPPAARSGFTYARKGRFLMAWKRYKDPNSGDEFTADELFGAATGLKPIDKEAVDASGRPLAPLPHTDKAGNAAKTKEA